MSGVDVGCLSFPVGCLVIRKEVRVCSPCIQRMGLHTRTTMKFYIEVAHRESIHAVQEPLQTEERLVSEFSLGSPRTFLRALVVSGDSVFMHWIEPDFLTHFCVEIPREAAIRLEPRYETVGDSSVIG